MQQKVASGFMLAGREVNEGISVLLVFVENNSALIFGGMGW